MTNTALKAQIDSQITNKITSSSITPTNVGSNIKAVVDYVDQQTTIGSAGDMLKSTYDTTNNGIVDNSEKLNGQSASFYAPISSPALIGTPTAPTVTIGDNSTKLATTAFVQASISTSGTYIPTFTNIASVASMTISSATYIKTGNIITVSISYTLTPLSSNANCSLSLTLPVNRTTANIRSVGSGSMFDNTYVFSPTVIQTDTSSTSLVNMYFKSPNVNLQTGNIVFQYSLI